MKGSLKAMSAGYSGTPLPQKLGIKPNHRIGAYNPPPNLSEILPGLEIEPWEPSGRFDIVLAFYVQRQDLEDSIQGLSETIEKNGSVWVCWPKRASKIPTDVLEQTLRDVILPMGLVDNKVCAVDEVWSGLRFVWRVELR